MTLCAWQHERGAPHTTILTDSEDVLCEERYVALKTLERNEGSAWLGRDIRQVGIGARLDSNLPAMSRARVWTKFIHDGRASSTRSDSQRRTVAQR